MKARMINTAFWSMVGSAAITGSCMVWHSVGCDIKCLAMAILFYSTASAGLWFVIDQRIQGK